MNLCADRLYALWQAVWQRISWQMLFVFGAGIFLWRNILFPMVADDYSYASGIFGYIAYNKHIAISYNSSCMSLYKRTIGLFKFPYSAFDCNSF